MKASVRTSLKLGVFALLVVLAVAGAVAGLGLRISAAGDVPYHAFFNESVQGLEIGAPVKYRGLTMGHVTSIEIAPDRRHVDVTMALEHRLTVVRELRAQLGTQGITGVKFVNLDWFDPAAYPPEALPFPTPPDTIPVAVSLMGGLEQGITKTIDRLPALLDAMVATLNRIEHAFEAMDQERIPEALAKTIANTNLAVTDLRVVLRQVAAAGIPSRTAKAIDDADIAMVKLSGILDRVGGDAGLVASTKKAADSVDDLSRRAAGSTDDLQRTLKDIGDAARAVRDLADALEHDPDMLVNGRAPRRSR